MSTATESNSNRVPIDELYSMDTAMGFGSGSTASVAHMLTMTIDETDFTEKKGDMIPLFLPDSTSVKVPTIGPILSFQWSKDSEDPKRIQLFMSDSMFSKVEAKVEDEDENVISGTYISWRYRSGEGSGKGAYEKHFSHDLGFGEFRGRIVPQADWGGKPLKKVRPQKKYSVSGYIVSLAIQGEDWKEGKEQGITYYYNKDSKKMFTYGTPPAA
ncbi:MAG: hypothetical protein SNF33_06095 [Candidatus Algichlamydia australiensis]|nr:hypothetical protein [Chlamydiales bacterium]